MTKRFYIYETATGKILFDDRKPADVNDDDFWDYVWDICNDKDISFDHIDWNIYTDNEYSVDKAEEDSSD